MSKTFNALLSRGIDSKTAHTIEGAGLSLATLKCASDSALKRLGLTRYLIRNIRSGKRPAIGEDVVIQLLYESRSTCCVCRDGTRSVILHHIKPWHRSRDNSNANLVVLCLEHHDLAHSKKQLSQNLTPKIIASHKSRWLTEVQQLDKLTITLPTTPSASHWEYINHFRLFELANHFNINNTESPRYEFLRDRRMVDASGHIEPSDNWDSQMRPTEYLYGSHICESAALYDYVVDAMDKVISKLPVVDLSENWNRTDLSVLATPGRWVIVSGIFYFKHKKQSTGFNQPCLTYHRRSGIRIESNINAWEFTSNRARSRLTRSGVATGLFRVHGIRPRPDPDQLTIEASCLGIGGAFMRVRDLDKLDVDYSHMFFGGEP